MLVYRRVDFVHHQWKQFCMKSLSPTSIDPNSPCQELSRDFEQRFSTPQRAEGNDTQAMFGVVICVQAEVSL